MKRLLLFCFCVLAVGTLTAQTHRYYVYSSKGTLAARPSTCVAGLERYVQTDATPNVEWICSSNGTSWFQASGGGSGNVTTAGLTTGKVTKASGTNAITDAAYADIVALFGGGACSGYLKNDGTCQVPAGAGDVVAGTMTSNKLTKTVGTKTVGDSLLTDDGTTLSYAGTGGVSVSGADQYINLPTNPTHTASAGDLWNNAGTLYLGSNPVGGGGGGQSDGLSTVSYSATPTFTASDSINAFKITLTGNVNSSTLSGGTAGRRVVFLVVQDATGGRSFTWPGNVHGGGEIGATAQANYIYTQEFIYDGTTWYAMGPLVENQ